MSTKEIDRSIATIKMPSVCSHCQGCSKSVTKHHRFDKAIRQQLKPLTQLDNYHGILAYATDVLMIAVSILVSLYLFTVHPLLGLVGYVIANAEIGSRIRALATILHESSHQTVAKNRSLNYALGMMAGIPIFQTWLAYRISHVLGHHPFLGTPLKDPDITYYIEQRLMDDEYDPALLWKHMRRVLLGRRTLANVRYLLTNRIFPRHLFKPIDNDGPRTGADRKRRSRVYAICEYMAFIVAWLFIIGAVIHFGLGHLLFWYWLVPYLTSFQVIGWFIELAEHYPLTKFSDYDLYTTRNRHGGRAEQFFTGIHAESWHLIHHLYPAIPFWNLEKAHHIFLQDAEYAKVTRLSGGIFQRGANGAPSILSQMQEQLDEHLKTTE